LVNVGDRVVAGHVIGLSGKTGYSFMPHLHFMVWHSAGGQWRPIPTRFRTSKGIKYMRPMRRYRHPR
jgi:murein DD-endopeptidase MepM/ murein hydrolase activator NlpD